MFIFVLCNLNYYLPNNLKPMEIKLINKSRLQHMEHFQFIDHVIEICKDANIKKMETVLASLQKAFENEDKALTLPRRQEGTRELIELDKARDQAYRALQLVVELNRNATQPEIKKSAEILTDILARYPRVVQANYDKASGMIKNLLTDLQSPAASSHVLHISAQPYVDQLELANKAFDSRYRMRLKSAVPTGTFDIKALRAETDKALKAVLRRMDSLDDLEPETPKLAELITHYNALVDKKNSTLSHRAGTSQIARDKRTAEYDAMLKPGFAQLEQFLGLPAESLSFTGKTEGSGPKRHYQLAIKGQAGADGKPRTIWVGVNKNGSLFEYKKIVIEKPKPKPNPQDGKASPGEPPSGKKE